MDLNGEEGYNEVDARMLRGDDGAIEYKTNDNYTG